MITTFKNLLLLVFVTMLFVSCNTEELFIEPVGEEVINLEDEEEVVEEEVAEEDEEPEVDPTLPCDFDLNTIEPNTTILINCMMDLQGQTINVPANVSIVYEGGDIINGTLNFSDNGIISGELLNSSLTLSGSTPQLKDSTFNFDPKRWDIVEGVVSDAIAKNNRVFLEGYFEDIKAMGANIFKIDTMDAYFKFDSESAKGRADTRPLNVPSDFHLLMTDNTHLRLQPNNDKLGCLLAIFKSDNVIIEGGNLHGDRDTHDYSDGENHEWGHTMRISASKNVTIKNMTIMDATGDGIVVHAFNHAFADTYRYSDNVLITNNKIIRARRNGISITDGKNIIIENNEIIDTGISTGSSDGTAPMWAIDIEPVWGSGGSIKYEIVENVIIRNNIEKGSEKGGFINARGSYITYENNIMESTIAIGQTTNSIVRNNTFNRNSSSSSLNVAIYAGDDNNYGYGNELNHSNEVYGNTITGFHKGIFLFDPEMDLHHNTMINCDSGIQIIKSRDSKIRDNTIINEISSSEGIGNKTTDYANNIDIYNNTIKVKGSPVRLTNVNLAEANAGFSITIRDNDLTSVNNSNSSFSKIRGFNFENNICNNSGIRTIEASIGSISKNTFENGIIRISQGCTDLSFIDNTITGGRCFQDDNTDAVNIIKQNNTCN